MSTPPPRQQKGLGEVAWGVARMTVRAAVTQVLNGPIIAHIAARMFENETGKAWKDLSAESQALWRERARSAMQAFAESIG